MINFIYNKKVLIIGYGLSGKSVYNFLKEKGVCVSVFDDHKKDISININDVNFNEIDIVIKSPAVPFMEHNCHHLVKEANKRGINVLSTLDIFQIYNPNAKIIAITGTNGKSTTTSLIHHIMKKAGFSVEIGGNIGIPYFDIPKADYYIFELSSYELASSKLMNFEIACILNIEPEHLEIHGNYENYILSKHKALDYAKNKIISFEDKGTLAKYVNSKDVTIISTENEPAADVRIFENAMFDDSNKPILDLSGLLNLRGKHNSQNIEFAYAICRIIGIPSKEIVKNIGSFKSLPHRLQDVRKINNILFINDSKATNPISTAKALEAFIGYNIYWLAGGRSKKIDPLIYTKNYLESVKNIYLFGEATQEFENAFKNIKNTKDCKTMITALNAAYHDALKETGPSVILLSPMCASFDQFKNFEERGNDFIKAVLELDPK